MNEKKPTSLQKCYCSAAYTCDSCFDKSANHPALQPEEADKEDCLDTETDLGRDNAKLLLEANIIEVAQLISSNQAPYEMDDRELGMIRNGRATKEALIKLTGIYAYHRECMKQRGKFLCDVQQIQEYRLKEMNEAYEMEQRWIARLNQLSEAGKQLAFELAVEQNFKKTLKQNLESTIKSRDKYKKLAQTFYWLFGVAVWAIGMLVIDRVGK